MRWVVIVFIVAAIPFGAHAEKSESLTGLMALSKMTGLCGAIKQMAAFQETTQMPSGNEFLLRFTRTEAARMGKDLKSFLDQCKTSVETYTRTYKMLEDMEKKINR
jgi:hypothetical protein